MRIPVLLAGLLLASPIAAGAESSLLNNGLVPPAPSNVIDDARYLDDHVYVRNVGCGTPYFDSPCASPGATTEVELADGGDLYALRSYDSSAITVSGGEVFTVEGNDTSSVAISGGNPRNVAGWGSSTVTIDGGDSGFGVYAYESSTIIINGGGPMGVGAYMSSTVRVNGGLVQVMACESPGTTITVTGGTVGDLQQASECGAVTVSGGTVAALWPAPSSTITVVGGSVGNAWLGPDSTVVVIGRGFAVGGSPVPYGDLVAETGTLTGRLASGELLDMTFDRVTAPNPGTIRLVEARPIPALSSWGYAALVCCLIGFGVVSRFRLR